MDSETTSSIVKTSIFRCVDIHSGETKSSDYHCSTHRSGPVHSKNAIADRANLQVWHYKPFKNTKKFGHNIVTLLHYNTSDIFDYRGDKSVSVEELLVEFRGRLDIISKIDMDSNHEGHLLFKQANLEKHNCILEIGATSNEYCLRTSTTNFQDAFITE